MSGDHFAILLGGSLQPTARLSQQIQSARIIAADGGIAHAETLHLTPELWVGDFDSTPTETLARLQHIPRENWPMDKDRTDGEIAADAAIARGAKSIIFVGAFGGQADHAFGNFLLAIAVAQKGIHVLISSGDEEAIPLIPGNHEFDLPPQARFSIIALSDLGGLSIAGAQWPLDQIDLPMGSSRTLSNVALGPIRLSLQKGYALAIAYPES